MKLQPIEAMKICVKHKLEQFQTKRSGGFRLKVYVWSTFVAVLLLVGITFAWYSLQKREAETKVANVMKPYYLTLLNPSETDVLQLAVGSLQQGQTKQIVFCVSSRDNTKAEDAINKNKTTFTYALELIHTDNLALEYEIYPLTQKSEADAHTSGIIVAADEVPVIDAATGKEIITTKTTYWSKKTDENETEQHLVGANVSAERWEQVGLTTVGAGTTDETNTIEDIINRGTYISYESIATVSSGDDERLVDNGLQLEIGEGASNTSQYFVLEIEWEDNIKDFSIYEKETDMIYILAKAVQPNPVKSTE